MSGLPKRTFNSIPFILREAFVGRSAVKLVQYKERFGISMAAMIYRAEKDGIIDERTSKWLWIQFSRNGWRAKEPGVVRPDRAVRFERLLDESIASKQLSWLDAQAITGASADELKKRRELAMGILGNEENDEEGGSLLKMHKQ